MSDALIVRRGGGGLSPNNAVIHVNAPAGSTISFSIGGVVAKVLGPGKSHVNAEDNTLADWYYSVSPANYGTWTVTATRGGSTVSKTVSVSAANQYDLELLYGLYFIKDGIIQDAFSVTVPSGNNPLVVTSNYDGLGYTRYYRPYNSSYYGAVVTCYSPGNEFPNSYSKLCVDYEIISCYVYVASDRPSCGFGKANTANSASDWFANQELAQSTGAVSRATLELDVSDLVASDAYLRIRVGNGNSGGRSADVHFYNVWLE